MNIQSEKCQNTEISNLFKKMRGGVNQIVNPFQLLQPKPIVKKNKINKDIESSTSTDRTVSVNSIKDYDSLKVLKRERNRSMPSLKNKKSSRPSSKSKDIPGFLIKVEESTLKPIPMENELERKEEKSGTISFRPNDKAKWYQIKTTRNSNIKSSELVSPTIPRNIKFKGRAKSVSKLFGIKKDKRVAIEIAIPKN